ncbi:hypothetical protein MNB_SV-9-15 [hydrothermal vent metagenome]|uniref:Co-chaperone DjlA N-terminal domain-containing protein n=1 Tax=hydrothermal vent metagenome TaxID=652676 RepID=A0A1W1BN66_9ZZZZ
MKNIKRKLIKMFREFLVYHNKSLEFRAKLLTLMVASDNDINPCEDKLLRIIANEIYSNNSDRANLLIDTVYEYAIKIKTNNGLNFEHLIMLVEKETKTVKRFEKKIDIELLNRFSECIDDEDDKIFNKRIIEFLENLKKEYRDT